MLVAWKRGLWPDPGLLVEALKAPSKHVVFGGRLQEEAAAYGAGGLGATDISAQRGMGLRGSSLP